MQMERIDPSDAETVLASHQVYLAAHETDDPDGDWMSLGVFTFWLARGWDGDPREVWAVRGPDGAVPGFFLLELPEKQNRTRARLELAVHPAARRRGLGQALLEHAKSRAVSAGRVAMAAGAWDGSPGEAFARQAGAVAALSDVRRVQDLTALPPLEAVRAEAERAAAGYSLVSWLGPVPEEYLAGVAELTTAMGDAPRSDGVERTEWDAERVSEDLNVVLGMAGLHCYSIAALHEATGEMAALTLVFVDPEVPGWAIQGNTSVTRSHRGHRLGLLVKLAMIDKLAAAEPGVTRLQTWNAAANPHMIAINETLGYQVLPPTVTEWELKL
jgi:GNAT superfamily N-acetyltransferase